ncbi:uncharacterized protein [Gossypium hirsutum]|uniref:Integrase catalytic domain-containing protein n=1 Tax=Gossypium hirsutum TaxID=3635 RepID=A0A1U8KN57_GOSHI|nr:uncharacterized protein LOC107917300 [Gossypium hirsutum]
MASNERLFKNLDRRFTSKVRVGNGNLIEARGKRDAVISTHSGNKVISDVFYVLDIDQNLLSVGQLIVKGYSLVFKNNSCVVEDSFGQVLVTVPMTYRYFMLDVNQLEKKAYTSATDLASLWHKRLGHVSYKSLGLLDRLNLVEGISKLKSVMMFLKFDSLVSRQDCLFQSIRHGELEFQKLCEQAGIHHQLTTVYTPQQNGVCERKNRSVLDMARCLLFESKLPSKFWVEVVNTSVYLLNRLPTTAVKEKTPFEAWHDLKPVVSHLKVFGCICYTIIPTEKRTKLDKSFVPGIFVGYSSTNKGYRFGLAEGGPVDDNFDEAPMRGIRTIADIYQRCDVTIVEPSGFEEATRGKC